MKLFYGFFVEYRWAVWITCHRKVHTVSRACIIIILIYYAQAAVVAPPPSRDSRWSMEDRIIWLFQYIATRRCMCAIIILLRYTGMSPPPTARRFKNDCEHRTTIWPLQYHCEGVFYGGACIHIWYYTSMYNVCNNLLGTLLSIWL